MRKASSNAMPKKTGGSECLWGKIVHTGAITVSFHVLLCLTNTTLICLICRLARKGEELCGLWKPMGRCKDARVTCWLVILEDRGVRGDMAQGKELEDVEIVCGRCGWRSLIFFSVWALQRLNSIPTIVQWGCVQIFAFSLCRNCQTDVRLFVSQTYRKMLSLLQD